MQPRSWSQHQAAGQRRADEWALEPENTMWKLQDYNPYFMHTILIQRVLFKVFLHCTFVCWIFGFCVCAQCLCVLCATDLCCMFLYRHNLSSVCVFHALLLHVYAYLVCCANICCVFVFNVWVACLLFACSFWFSCLFVTVFVVLLMLHVFMLRACV